ncbi:type II secretion system protein GspD [Rubripirellula reticaptiva]|uniref:Type II secretion system protein D n=1 Tax=Rubripirellula reticaptiva TaxID=2528013 RepID=A0A5C6EM56_9BACT|nr:secretin N-terminal domain-containing protein [Rubripirellula reticaptiva]TWU49217.1 Type II secretion system protein D precursor [Rubripirellula reticaptiva]
MDGNETNNNPIRVRRSIVIGMGLLSATCLSSIAVGQTPRAFDPSIDARPIELAHAWPAGEGSIVRPRAKLISAKASPFTAALTAAAAEVDEDRRATNAPQPWVSTPLPNSDAARTSHATSSPSDAQASQSAEPRTVDEALQMRGTVSFRKTPLSEVVFLLSDLWKINIVAGEEVSGEVSGTFFNAPLSEVLAAALTSSGYSYRKTGSSLVVLSADQVGMDDPSFISETVTLPSSLRDDNSTLEAAEMLLSERGQMKKIGVDMVLVIDKPERIERVRNLFASLSPTTSSTASATVESSSTLADTASELPAPLSTNEPVIAGIAYFTPQFTEADELAEPLRMTLGDSAIVAVYSQENRIMVKGTPAELQTASEIVTQLDVARQQVRITAMIYDVSLSELEQIGVNWSREVRGIANAQNEALVNVTENVSDFLKASSSMTTTGAASVGIRTITGAMESSVFLEALDSTSEAKLLADPSITVGDRREASIRIVRKIPIVGANPVSGSNAVFTQTEFEEAGVILKVKPRISRDGTIEMEVSPEYSVVAEITSTGPVIDSRTAQTFVRVANGQMFVLGGLRQKSIVESNRGIPFLRDLKYVGGLFRSHDTEVRESELIVFLKPEIVTPYFTGTPREQRAAQVTECQLDQIPYAEACPQSPYCRDTRCPNHHPRPRLNAGSSGLMMIGGDGIYETTNQFPSNIQNIEVEAETRVPTIIETTNHEYFPPVVIDARISP